MTRVYVYQHTDECEEWCNHCEVCGLGIMWGSRCHDHLNPNARVMHPSEVTIVRNMATGEVIAYVYEAQP